MLTVNMIALLLLGFLACSSAAPHYHRHGLPFHDDFHHRFFQDDVFDTRGFWDEMRRELLDLDSVLDDFTKHFHRGISTEGIEGDVYKITIPLIGFEDKDIVVKAKQGLVMIQAVHKNEMGGQHTYMDVRSLPACVNVTGKWSYDNEILIVEFPVNGKDTDVVNTDVTTEQTVHSREEMEPDNDDTTHNADTGVERGDNVEIMTNVVPGSSSNGIEATTYAVDLKDEVEFVPVRQV